MLSYLGNNFLVARNLSMQSRLLYSTIVLLVSVSLWIAERGVKFLIPSLRIKNDHV